MLWRAVGLWSSGGGGRVSSRVTVSDVRVEGVVVAEGDCRKRGRTTLSLPCHCGVLRGTMLAGIFAVRDGIFRN